MPGNEYGDRVHNFFAQDNAFQGQPESQVVEGNWPVLSNNFWIGGQRQADALHSNNKTYNLQDPDIDRAQGSYPFHVTQGLNFTQSSVRADFSKNQSLNEQPNLNGYIIGNQFPLSRQNEANFLTVDTDSEPHHGITSRGFSVHELQQGSGMENGAKTSLRSETSVPSVSLDLFGGQQQMSHHQSSMLQPVQHQHPGINNMQQQHLMIKKMQDLQRQQQFQPLEIRQQNHINQVPVFAKQSSGSHSTPIDGNPVSDLQQYPWTTEVGGNWMNRGSPSMQGTQTGLVFPPNLGQPQHLVDLVPQPVDQSLYGIPVSGSRGLNVNQYSHKVTDRSPMLQVSTSTNTLQGNHNFFADQVGLNDEDSIARRKFQNENMIGRTPSQSLYSEPRNMGSLLQVNSIQSNAPQDFLGRQELTIRPETPSEKSRRPAVASSNEVSLDPAEEKILFGSDDNEWAAFGNAANMPGESGNLFDNGESLNGFPSIHSGSWSALMQSAVAESSSNDMVLQEEWSGLIFHNVNGSSANQSSSVHNNNVKQQSSLVDDKTRMPSAPSPGSIPPSGDSNVNDVTGLNLLGHRFLNEPGQRLSNEVSERFTSLEEGNKWSNYIAPQNSVAEDSQIYRDASQNSPEAGMSAMKISSPWAHQQSGSQQQSNGRNTLVAIPTGGDSGLNVHQAEKCQNSSNQFMVMQGEAVGGSLWKSNSVSRSATELGPAKPTIRNPETNEVILSLNDAASVANVYSVGVADETNPFFHNSNKINQWKNSNSSTIFQGVKDLGRTPHQAIEYNQGLDSLNSCEKEEVTRNEMENYDMKENSNDSHRSNLSWHTSGGFRETGSGASDSKSLLPTNQKLTNQLSRKISVPRKFQYHPMGNSDEDAEPSYHLKQSTNLQAMSQSNSYLDQSNFLVQYPRNSKLNEQGQSSELQKHNKVMSEESPHGGLPGYSPNISVSYSRPFDSFTPNAVSSSGQNMLELLPKVDHSRGHGDMMHLSSERKVAALLSEAEKVDGFAGFFQQNQSSVYQGFGLQLGPPSLQRGQIPDHSSSSQKAQSTVNSMPVSHAAAEMGEKGQRMVSTSTIQSLNFPNGKFQAEFKNNIPAVPPRHAGSDETRRNFQEALSSGSPHVSQLQNQQVMRSSGKIMMNQHVDSSFSSDVSNKMRRGSMETVLLDSPGDIQKVNVMSSRGMTQQAGPNDAHERGPTSTASARDPLQASQHFSMHGIPRQGSPLNALHTLTTNVYTNQHSLGAQYQKASSPFSDLTQPNTGESSSAPLTQGGMNVCKGGDLSSDLRSIYVNSPGVVDGEEQRLKESVGQSLSSVRIDTSNKNNSDCSPVDLFSTQKNIEAFGRSLKPNSFTHQNHASLNQMKAFKDAGDDPSCRVSKRMKGPNDCSDVDRVASMSGQQNDHGLVLGDSLGSSIGVPSDDLRMPNFLLAVDSLQIDPSQHGNVASQDILARGTNVSHSNSSTEYAISVRAECPEVSPQMTPSWFNQYGPSKNGQMLHSYNAHTLIPSKSGELGKSPSVADTLGSEEKGTDAPTDVCQGNMTHQTSTTSTFVSEPLSSGCSYELNATAQNLVIWRPKKRKTATSELQPWHEEIADGSQSLSSLSVAETVWSQVANRLKEKVHDDAELIEVGPSFLRSKRRLILTTQLMQQLFYPLPGAILSADANVKCESVAYAVSRTVLGNACNTVFHSSCLDLPCGSAELLSAKGKSSERNVDRYSGKVMESLMGRLGKLENDFLRLEKSSSIFDVRMECLDLEKFSVINRLAKFHGQGQTDTSDTAPSNKPLPQRYVAAIPMPRSLPDRNVGNTMFPEMEVV